MALHTITSAVGAVCRCKAKAGLRRSPRGLRTRTRLTSLLRLNLDSSLKTTWFYSAAVQFLPRRLRTVREDAGALSETATCAWMAADEAVGCTWALLTMWRSSRRLIGRGRPEPGHRVNDISRIHWSQHLLTTQSEWPN
ncbi:uncharacterized protein TNCV_4058921 [Trichonephila clavipes]|nr:uncharacterized protein TNCV_4058921 [Trichonephila clavipes]